MITDFLHNPLIFVSFLSIQGLWRLKTGLICPACLLFIPKPNVPTSIVLPVSWWRRYNMLTTSVHGSLAIALLLCFLTSHAIAFKSEMMNGPIKKQKKKWYHFWSLMHFFSVFDRFNNSVSFQTILNAIGGIRLWDLSYCFFFLSVHSFTQTLADLPI